ncbi:phage tail protein [Macrococcus brunensis]|uniref:Phage tail protein n=1 Tax=Macrococcus brunensis TaxID=198483 RepID=A0A4R6BCY2_9STAP|nr:major tail protein [Macrococcus brunensis]TDL96684.1 phage tail protein [Macrococcus brunensis]
MVNAQAKTPKAYINVKDLGFAVVSADELTGTTYTKVTQTRGLQKIGVETGGELKEAYADGLIIEAGNTDGKGKITMTMHAFPAEIREIIFNEKADEKGIVSEVAGQQNNYVAVWFKRERRDGTYQLTGLTKVMFSNPKIEGETAKADWDFSSEDTDGTAMHRQSDRKRKITWDSATALGTEDDFFTELLKGAYEAPAPTQIV